MKREILFRGFDQNMKEWVYGSYLHKAKIDSYHAESIVCDTKTQTSFC